MMPRGCIRAKYVPLCPECGRILELFEFCECFVKLPKDGLRASCPKFIARTGYRGKHYINCGGRKLRFETRKDRDQFYMDNCCCSPGSCTAMDGSVYMVSSLNCILIDK